jgi:hypothetical protein
MRRVTLLIAAVTILLIATAVPATGRPSNPFVGAWENVDSVDMSDQRVTIGGSGHFRYVDRAATACLDAGFGFVPASLRGTGTFATASSGEPTFTFTADLYCHVRGRGGRVSLGPFTLTFTYDATSDTLADSEMQGCWHRPRNPGACAAP